MGNALGTPPTGPKGLPQADKSETDEPTLRNFKPEELAEFDGTNRKPIYVSLKSEVYDVTESDYMFGPGGEYHALAGKDASRALATGVMTEKVINDLDLSDLDQKSLRKLDDWIDKFCNEKKFPLVGRLVIPMDLTLDELRKFNGTEDPRGTTLVAVNGTIYDVTLNGLAHYGPDGSYSQFAGRDASRALALMSLDDACLDDPHIDDLSDVQQSSLADWATRFQQKYAAIGRVVLH